MNKILIATDLSPRSDRALERAVSLAQQHRAHLFVTHIVDEDLPASVVGKLKAAADQVIREHLASLPAAKSLAIEVKVVFGKDFADILQQAQDEEVDLIVLGTHREGTFQDMFSGTTVERILRKGDFPTLVVKNRVHRPYKTVVVAIDFSVYSRRAVEFAFELVQNGEFHLVHAFDVPFKGLLIGQETRREVSMKHEELMKKMIDEELQAFFATFKIDTSRLNLVMKQGEVCQAILQEVDRLNPDLLVVGTHGRTGVAHALLGSVAENLLGHPPCDVLAVHAW